MNEEILLKTEKLMDDSVKLFINKINKINIYCISPSLIKNLKIKYCNKVMLLHTISSIIVENNNTILIDVFDKKLLPSIKKAIRNSKLELNQSYINNKIRISNPILTNERRHNILKIINNESEIARISIRNIRHNSLNKIKSSNKKNKSFNKDEFNLLNNKIQEITNFWIKKINNQYLIKEKEILNNN
ncbi:MAG: ribosome recycling factor [Candidatus Lightella neohaematopini]|nr:ribosome recycling factor [Candidatus Lightella neohaematopini]MCV2531299.1 ribosome recycling factor [Candidatus Lightella neohaematopini]